MLANTWGTVIGSKVVSLRTAILLGVMCQMIGTIFYGPRSTPVFAGILYDWTVLKPYPGLTLYAIGWTIITTVTWQFLAIWKRIMIPVYLGSGELFFLCLAQSCIFYTVYA